VTDEKLESLIGNILRTGVMASAVVVAVAGGLYLIQHYAEPVHYGTFQMENSNLRTLHGIVAGASRLRSDATIQLGLLLLIATPIARVALDAIGFYLERDRLYVGVSLTVLAVLIFSLMHSA